MSKKLAPRLSEQLSLPLDNSSAVIDGQYRYLLTRVWDERKPGVTFVMLNPSTADATEDDPTLRRCIHFASAFGYGRLNVVNLFAYRATDPRELFAAERDGVDIVGPECSRYFTLLDDVICAWGAQPGSVVERRVREVKGLLLAAPCRVFCLGCTKDGHPRHPLYLSNNTPFRRFEWDQAEEKQRGLQGEYQPNKKHCSACPVCGGKPDDYRYEPDHEQQAHGYPSEFQLCSVCSAPLLMRNEESESGAFCENIGEFFRQLNDEVDPYDHPYKCRVCLLALDADNDDNICEDCLRVMRGDR